MATTQTLLTFEEFTALPDEEGVFRELDEGVVIEMPYASPTHGRVQGNTTHLLMNWLQHSGADFQISQSSAFRLGPRTVRAPDVWMLPGPAYRAMEYRQGALHGAPDVAVEVISPSNTGEDIDRKVDQYLRARTQAVWLLYSETRHVIAHRPGEIRKYESGQMLEEPGLLPGLAIPVDELFAGI
jgi:Uma2 family endonuclease